MSLLDAHAFMPMPHPLHSIMNHAIRVMPKVWGSEHWIVNSDKYCLKVLTVVPGYQCSLHYHKNKDETFIVQQGQVLLEQRDIRGYPYEELLSAGEQRHIAPKTPHRFQAKDAVAVIIEISTHHDDADVVRIEDSKKI